MTAPRRRRRLDRFLWLLLPLPVAFLAPATTIADLPADDLLRLAAGGTLVRLATAPAVEGWAARILEAPAERVARAVGDWRHYDEFFPFVASSEVTVGADGVTITRQTLDPPGPLRDRHVVADVEHRLDGAAPRRIWRLGWRSTTGDERPTRGEWTIREIAPGRTRVEIRLSGHLGLPPALERRALARTLPWVLDGLAQQVSRCRYDQPRHPTCEEAPAFTWPSTRPTAGER